ncbi:PAS domain-containing sensor histidine kinase [Pontibacter liquoris]|uniref:PAS domain-containing sensor histidine kinase n=1 Tax=Pontibacter liquoris TaxID=2905677 RepID=UPI001FA6D17C|nr:PAS domain S-box protein [Pontibacter liquoris]
MNSESEAVSHVDTNKATEDNFRLLIEGITDYAIFLLDPSGYITTWNAGAARIKQYAADEIIGKHFSTFYSAEAKAAEYPAYELQEALKQGHFEDEGWRLRKDGTAFWANVVITPIYNQARELIGFAKITRDLSERKKAEDDLLKAFDEVKENEERFRQLVEGVADYAIFMLDPVGNITTWNEGARKLNGYEAHEIIGKYFAKFYSREAVEQGFPAYELQQAKQNGRFEDEGWRYRKDGSAFWANTVLTAIYDSQKQLLGFSKITRDLTERKKLEQQLYWTNQELKENEERSRLLIDSVKDYAILMLSPDGIVSSWNVGAERIKGYKAAEIIGKHFSTFYPREAIESGFPQYELRKALDQGHFEDEGWRLRKDGTAFWANVVITPIHNPARELIGFAKVTRDLTERRRNEDLMRKNNELLKINNELDNFVYAASHDLKSPIINLEGLLAALKEDLGPEGEHHSEVLTRMDGAITILKKVVSDLGDVARLQQSNGETESINLPDLLAEVTGNISELIAASNAEIIADFSGFKSLTYSRKNLRSILFNLVSNAIKYAHPQRRPQVRVKTHLASTGLYCLSVADNGLGITSNQTSKIFSLFKRAHDHVEGSGIGLYLVKKILDNSGDSIVVDSVPDKGSVFSICFKQKAS